MPDLSTTERAALRGVVAGNLARCALGLALLVAPRRLLAAAQGGEPPGQAAIALARGLAARDLALGLGAVLAARRDPAAVRGWTEAGAVADLGDALGVARWTTMPALLRLTTLTVATGAAIAGVAGARILPRRSAA